MEDAVTQRIKLFFEKKQLSVNAASKKAGMNQTTLNRQLNGTNGLSVECLVSILQAFEGLSAEWLLRGTEPMELTNHVDEEIMKWRLAYSDLALENNQLKRELANLKGDTQSRA